MNILFLTEGYYPKMSGVPVVVKYLAEGLAKNGHTITVVTPLPDKDCKKNENINGVSIVRFRLWRDFVKNIHGEKEKYRQYILSSACDAIVVECAQALTTDLLSPIIKKINAPLILHAHGLSGLLLKPYTKKTDILHTIGNTLDWLRMKLYFGYFFRKDLKYYKASISLTNCDSGFDYLRKHVKNNYVLGNAAEDLFFKPAEHFYLLDTENKPYIVSIANYTVIKNQIQMLRQYYKSNSSKDYSLVLIGSQKNQYYYELKKEYQQLEEKYGHRTVLMLTGIERFFLPSILDNATLYLVSSTYEEYSISLIEAMARGLPFISTDVGNARDLPGGITVDSINVLNKAIDKTLNNNLLLEKLSKEAKIYAWGNCRIIDAVDNLEKIIIDVLKHNRNE